MNERLASDNEHFCLAKQGMLYEIIKEKANGKKTRLEQMENKTSTTDEQ